MTLGSYKQTQGLGSWKCDVQYWLAVLLLRHASRNSSMLIQYGREEACYLCALG